MYYFKENIFKAMRSRRLWAQVGQSSDTHLLPSPVPIGGLYNEEEPYP